MAPSFPGNPSHALYRMDVHENRRAVTWVSPNALAVVGHAAQSVVGDASWWATHLHDDDRNRAEAAVTDAEKAGSSVVHYRSRGADGSYRRVRDEMWVEAPATGEAPLRLSGVWSADDEDGTAMEDRFRAVTEASPNIIIITRMSDGRISYVNPAVSTVGGIAPEALIGHLAPEFYANPGDRAEYVRRLKEAGRVRDFEVLLKKADGTPYWALLSSSVITLDGEPHILAEVVDITLRKELTDAAVRSEARFRDFAETASDWYWETDADLRFSFISYSAYKFVRAPTERSHGKTRAEVLSRDLEGAGLSQEELDAHVALQERREPFRDFRYWVRDGKGERHHISVSGKPVFAPDGTFMGYRGTGRDVTELTMTMEALRVAKEEAEAANAAKSYFLASMSHELRTPLNAIIGFSQLLELRYGQISEVAAKENLRHISSSGEHLLGLVNQVLDLARIESGHVDLHLEKVPVLALATECAELIDPIAHERSVSVELPPVESEMCVWADRFRVKQILINLLSNAIKYNVPGGSVRISVAPATGGAVRIAIIDTGAGIAKEKHAQLFEPFSRLGRESLNIEGAGIGLSLSKRLVEMMDGAIGFESEPGHGSTFWVDLPSEKPSAGR